MLEEATQDAAHGDVFAHAGNAWTQTANSTDHQVNLHAGLAGLIQGGDGVGIALGARGTAVSSDKRYNHVG